MNRLDELLTAERVTETGALLDRLAVLISAQRAEHISALVDQAPRLVGALRAGDVPTSRELRQIAPDLHAALELIDELHQVVTGMPGAGRARERGAEPHPQV